MKHITKRMLSFVLALAMVLSCMSGLTAPARAAATEDVTVTADGDSIIIGNGYISREFSTAGEKLSTTQIVNHRTEGDTVFTPGAGSEEFVVRVAKEGDSGTVSLPAMDRTGWTAVADSYHNASGDSDGPASNLLDGRTESIWHTNYGGGTGDQSYPYNVVITLNGSKTFSCFSYTPRQQGEDTNGNIKGYELYYATAENQLGFEDAGWVLASRGEFQYEGVNPIYVNLDEAVTATQVKLVAISSKNGQSFAGGAEFNLHEEKAPVDTNDREFAASALVLDGEPVIADTTAVINEIEKTGKMVTFHFKPFEFKGVTYTISEVVVMYDGDHFMRKYMEIEASDKTVAIDYIDLESLVVNDSDQQWTIPHVGGVVQMSEFKANLGQPIYIQGMFFGCEFPATDTQIENGVGRMRYYTGKSFERFEADNQLTTDGKYVTWQTVAGAARSTDMQVIQADFFEYIYSIATPSEFRIQYNSWFDNMMLISDESILESFIEIDQELNKVEVRPLDSYVVDDGWINYNNTYVVDAARAGTTLNQSGFWEFNSKFPNELYPSSELANKFGSNFGLWVGPRGGYNFYGHLADIIAKSGKGSKAGGSIDVADRVYVQNLTDMFCDFQDRFQVNYWKWDGFADGSQYGAFPAADGVPGYANRHMTGGYQNMYHVTDLWEAWIDLMEAVRANARENGIDDLWLSLTCYTNPSPWFLQWANSVWMQCVYDQKDAGFGTSKMDKQMTYRDAVYYDFLVNHQFQFPLANLYNHDPIYGKEGTGMTLNSATDDNFQNYLYMQSTRGITFWELLFSDSILTDGKYEVTGEFLEWAEENSHILRNAKIFGGMPDVTKLENGDSNESQAEAYGFSCFDGTDGIISIRNPHSYAAKTVSFTFDRNIGVTEDAGTLKYYLVHNYNMPEGNELTGEFTYGETYTFTIQPNEVRMFQISAEGDTTAPVMERAFSDGDKVITVRFNEKTLGDTFTVSGATVESVERSADDVTYRITLTEAPADKAELTVTAEGVTDISGNACTESISLIYNAGNLVTDSLQTNYGFTVSADVAADAAATLVSQGDAYALGINDEGKAYFTVNGATAVSEAVVTDGESHTIIGVKENNGMLKLYVDGTLEASAYKAENRWFTVPAAEIVVSELADKAAVYDIAFGYDELNAAEAPESTVIEGISGQGSSTDTSEPAHDKSVGNAFDGNYDTFWATTPGGSLSDAWLIADLGETYTIDQVDYTKRFDAAALYNCTGNLLDYIIEVSADGENWQQVASGDTVDGTTEIAFEPVEARYVRLTATRSYHWQDSNANTVMCVAELAVHKYIEPIDPNDPWGKTKWVRVAVDSETIYNDREGEFEFAWDGDLNTIWHSNWQGAHDVLTGENTISGTIDFTKAWRINQFSFTNRQDATDFPGYITQASLYVKENESDEWTCVGEHVEFDATKDQKTFHFAEQKVRYVKFVAEKSSSMYQNNYSGQSQGWVCISEFDIGYEKQPEHTHSFGEWTITTEPTCTEAGVETRSCDCGETETREVTALGHDYVDGVCTRCGAAMPTESQKLTGVTGRGSSVDTSEPAFDKSVGNAFDGDYSTFWATVPEDTLADAWLIADLGGSYTIDKVEYTKRYDATAGYNCTGNLLDYIIEVSTDGENWTRVAAGDTIDGTTGITFEPVQAAYVRLTATRSYHWQESSANTVMTVAELAVFGTPAEAHVHTAGEAVIENETAATCTVDGSYDSVVYCAECGEELSRETVAVPATGHTEEVIPGKAPTCTETGLTEGKKCAVCGEILVAQEEIAALGHSYEAVVTAPTCTEKGYTTYTCSVCGDSYVADETDALGHAYESVVTEPTCTEQGYTTHTCAICGDSYVDSYTEALGHKWKGTKCENCDATRENPFVDVPEDSFYIDPVLWAVEEGITTGVDETHFNPNGQCQRAVVVTFLWRAAGSPEPASTVNPFTDVKESDFFYKAVLWAVEKGITNGLTADQFGPYALCNRAQVVTFLWRAQGQPAPTSTTNPFTDVNVTEWYGPAVLWAVEKGVTNGMGDGTFGVGGICNRAQVVTFLYRALVK